MADNTELDAGSGGDVIRTDDDGTAKWQYVKLAFGADNTQTIVGSISSNPLPVALSDTDNAVLDAIAASLALIDNAIPSGNELQCDIVAALPVGSNAIGKLAANSGVDIGDVTLNAGTAEIGKLAAGVAEIGNVKNSGTFVVQSTLQTGSNAIGKLAANSGVDIGDVDVTSLPGSMQGPASPTIDSYTQVAINLTTGADQVLVSSAVNKQIWVYGYGFTCGDADGQTVSFQDEDNVALSGIMEFAQYGGMSVSPSGNFSMPIWKLGTNKDLEVDITSGDVDGWIVYAIVSV